MESSIREKYSAFRTPTKIHAAGLTQTRLRIT